MRDASWCRSCSRRLLSRREGGHQAGSTESREESLYNKNQIWPMFGFFAGPTVDKLATMSLNNNTTIISHAKFGDNG